MTSRTQQLLREALTLPAEERADVAAELLASLDEAESDMQDVETAWAAEIAPTRGCARTKFAWPTGIPAVSRTPDAR
jgi:hypothetical protein